MTSWASDDQKAVAADFIKFLHTPEQLAAYFEATGVPPADDRFDPEAIEDPLVRQLFDWGTENPAPQFENFVPFDIWFNGFNTAQVQMITGQITSPGGRARPSPRTWPTSGARPTACSWSSTSSGPRRRPRLELKRPETEGYSLVGRD